MHKVAADVAKLDDYTIDELISVCISRQVKDGEVWAQGINTPLVMAGLFLAKCTHAPNIRFASAIGQGICQDWSPMSITKVEEMWLGKSLNHVGFAAAAVDMLPRYQPREFFRPAQIDPAGNTNNIAFGSNYSKPRLRLPGAGGIPDVTTRYEHSYLYVPRHSKIVFQEKIDFISGLGHSPKRKRGAGPRYLVTDLGQFDWHNGRMRLVTVHPGISTERIHQKTGFEIDHAASVDVTPIPSPQEIHLLRNVIDPLNIRKLETLAGAERKQLLREILVQEGSF